MYRFFEEKENILDEKIYLSKENLHHMNVLRIEEDEQFEIVSEGVVYEVVIDTENSDTAKILNTKEDENESNIRINLFQGLPKQDKFEWIVQKTTELGVTTITPFSSSRTIVKWDEKKEKKKLLRYQGIAKSAAKQSKRSIIPTVEALISFNDMIDLLKDKLTILAYENRGYTLRKVLEENKVDEINIIIGPEGGFSEEEVKLFEESGAYIVNIGNRILRTETAAIALTTMIQYECGDIN